MQKQSYFLAIDQKSFYASVECADRHLDPLTTNLVVADESRTDKTICLAVSPSLKAVGVPGRPRLFEVIQKVEQENKKRLRTAIAQHRAIKKDGKYTFATSSFDAPALEADPSLELSYIIAPPRMARYMEVSAQIYSIYLKYVSPEDIHPYSCDEVFIDITHYLSTYHMTPHELAMVMIREVLYETGITATAGIGTNLYLAKVAMDIVAKKAKPDKDGVRIAELDEISYREQLWNHKPLTDFWRVGHGTATKLEKRMIYTMGDLARYSFADQEWFYKTFGINAELLIDHAWGIESCTMADIKSYKPSTTSVSEGQVLSCPTEYKVARLIIAEMADNIVLQLVEKGYLTDSLSVYVGYDRENITPGKSFTGAVSMDHYGRAVPKPVHGSTKLKPATNLGSKIISGVLEIFDKITDQKLLIRRLNVCAGRLVEDIGMQQMDMFTDTAALEREKRLQEAMMGIKSKFGKNAILRGISYMEGATARERNGIIGGHKAESDTPIALTAEDAEELEGEQYE